MVFAEEYNILGELAAVLIIGRNFLSGRFSQKASF